MKEAKKTRITEQICKQAQLMRKGGANQTEIGKLLGVNPCTISRIEAAGFDFDKYTENLRARKMKETMKAEEPAEQISGQMEMDLTQAEKPEMSEQVKMMRFQAAQADRILKKTEEAAEKISGDLVILNMTLDKINDTLCMLLRAIRRE